MSNKLVHVTFTFPPPHGHTQVILLEIKMDLFFFFFSILCSHLSSPFLTGLTHYANSTSCCHLHAHTDTFFNANVYI